MFPRAPVLEALAIGVPVKRVLVLMSYAAGERGGSPTTARRTLEESLETMMIHQIRRDTELARLKYDILTAPGWSGGEGRLGEWLSSRWRR